MNMVGNERNNERNLSNATFRIAIRARVRAREPAREPHARAPREGPLLSLLANVLVLHTFSVVDKNGFEQSFYECANNSTQ